MPAAIAIRLRPALILCLITAALAGCASGPTLTSADEAAVLARVSTEALIKEYVSRREAAIWNYPPKLDTEGIKSTNELIDRVDQHKSDMKVFGKELLRQSIIFSEAGYAPALGISADLLWDKQWAELWSRDVCRSLGYAFEAALANNPVAMAIIADAYRNGDGLQKDDKRAYFWAREVIHRYWPRSPKYQVEEIVNNTPQDIRQKLDQEWMQWKQIGDVLEQRKEICK